MNYLPNQDPWDLLQMAHTKIDVLVKSHNDLVAGYSELKTQHNKLVTAHVTLEKQFDTALDSIQQLQESHLRLLKHIER